MSAQLHAPATDLRTVAPLPGPPVVSRAPRPRWGAAALSLAGVGFVGYPALRPFSDETTLGGAAAFASTRWLVAHTTAMVAFILLGAGLFALHQHLAGTSAGRDVRRGASLAAVGIALTLPYYGAETFALHAVGQQAVARHDVTLLTTLTDHIRWGEGIAFIIPGLLLMAAGTVTIARAIWQTNALPRWTGVPLALGFALYVPQYAAAQPIRVAHGLLLTAGCALLAHQLRSQRPTTAG